MLSRDARFMTLFFPITYMKLASFSLTVKIPHLKLFLSLTNFTVQEVRVPLSVFKVCSSVLA